MAEDVAVLVLHHRLSDVRTEAEVGDRLAGAIELLDREVLQHHDAAAVEQLAAHVAQGLAKRAKPEIFTTNAFDRNAIVAYRFGRADQLRAISIGDPVVLARDVAQ